jgi:hypothetical protein
MSIKKYNDFIKEEESFFKRVVISLASMISIGLTKSQVDVIKDDPAKMSVVETLLNYNKDPKGTNMLKYNLLSKVDNPQKFIHDYLIILPDKTVIVKPNFINGLELNLNPVSNEFNILYTIKF